jgi:magnesium-transporting ATPase (P-type)
MIRVLFIAGIVSIVISFYNEHETYPWAEGFSIICACLFITTLTALCEWGKNKQYMILHDAIREEKVAVIRGNKGLSETRRALDLVVGDIITIEAGMRIPADCILIDGMDIKCDESMYFGLKNETIKKMVVNKDHMEIENPDVFLLSRSLVISGSGRAVVCAVGKRTRWYLENPIEDLKDDDEKTPLAKKLDTLS